MEKDTVLLDVEKYNELRDFRKNIEEGYTATVYHSYVKNNYNGTLMPAPITNYISTDEAVEQIAAANKSLRKEITSLKEYIAGMTVREFRKWRKS